MSSYGTEKFQTTSLRLGMPSAFQNAYAHNGAPEQYAPDIQHGQPNLPIGNDFQAVWHQQKMRDAHHMANAKVQSTHMMYKRSNSSAHGVYGMPQPVLGQRQFANPSMGASQSGNPAREDFTSAPWHFSDASALKGGAMPRDYSRLVGGTLRTAQGQAYGMSLLHRRIAELDAISALKNSLTTLAPDGAMGEMAQPPPQIAFPGAQPTPSQSLAQVPTVELSQLLQNILDSLDDGEGGTASRLTYQDSVRAFSLIVRLATTGSAENITDVIEFIDGGSSGDGILPKLQELVINPIEAHPQRLSRLYLSLKEFWERIKVYLTEMLKTEGQPFKSRSLASQTWIKSLQFTKVFRGKLPDEFINADDAQQALDENASFHSSFHARGWRGQSESSSSRGAPDARGRGARMIRREDTQHGYIGDGDAEFDTDDRQRFAYASGEFPTGGREVGEEPPPLMSASDAEEEGEEEYLEDALNTNPSNAGPRLVSRRDETTGEFDVAPASSRSSVKTAMSAPKPAPRASAPSGLPPFLKSRTQIPNTKEGLIAMAKRLNTFYNNRLPDGKGPISVSAYSKVRSAKTNFIRRLKM